MKEKTIQAVLCIVFGASVVFGCLLILESRYAEIDQDFQELGQ